MLVLLLRVGEGVYQFKIEVGGHPGSKYGTQHDLNMSKKMDQMDLRFEEKTTPRNS